MSEGGVNEPTGQAPQGRDDPVRELVWVLRRAMYVFIVWAEKRYGWRQRPSDEERQ